MLTLLLIMALMAIAAAIIVPTITFEIRHDREEEMIHRGVQYARAISAYYRKFNRYPTKIEDLESTNNLRFLRKRYKDPMNCANSKCQDFKLLYYGDVKMSFNGSIGGGTIPGATPAGALGASGSSGTFGSSSTLGGSSSFGANSNSAFGSNQQTATSTTGSDASSSSQPGTSPAGTPGQDSSSTSGSQSGASSNGSGQVFGGGPIVGVVSAVKCPPRPEADCQGYREFNHKKKYSEWQFIYDPALGAGMLMTPNQQPLQGFGQSGTQNLNGQNGNNGSAFGSGNSFGSSGSFGSGNSFGASPSGFQNNPNSPQSGGFGNNPNPPSSPPQQQ